MSSFNALLLTNDDGKFSANFRDVSSDALPEGDLLIRVEYSSLNYKDGLAVTGRPGVVRKWPMVPGIDLAGVVEESNTPEFAPGSRVVVTGCGTSEVIWGGYAQMARIKAEYAVPLPRGMTTKQAMGVGTAGFTAMQAIMALERQGMKPGGREIVVTGAAGGVGSVAIALLAKLGYRAIASTGRESEREYLKELGAADLIGREVLNTASKKPLESERWGGAIDNVGADTLAGLLRTMAAGTSIAACGLAGGNHLNTTVIPFIIRGVSLLGINSVATTNAERRSIWARLVRDLPLELLDRILQVEPLSRVPELGEDILAGRTRGRIVIDVNS